MSTYRLEITYRDRQLVEARLSRETPDGWRDTPIAGGAEAWPRVARELARAGHRVEIYAGSIAEGLTGPELELGWMAGAVGGELAA